ncbi:MAG: malto-oligosyltrehalose synthase [Nitriliruptorales bacterium]
MLGQGSGTPHTPGSTYRLQFNRRFRLRDAAELVDYFDALGIRALYASPLLAATRGTEHGYHVTDPTTLNPEVGGAGELAELTGALERTGMGLLVDIVPNHLAASSENPWWVDVLEHGPASPWAAFFDIDWEEGGGRLVLPILGRPVGEALEEGQLKVALDQAGLHVVYYDTRLPLDPATYPLVLEGESGVVLEKLGSSDPASRGLLRVVESARQIPPRTATDAHSADGRRKLAEEVKLRLWTTYASDPRASRAVGEALRVINTPQAVDRLAALLTAQAYRLVFWRSGLEELNYRRFFDITDLVGVRVEDPHVFRVSHERLLQLVADGTVTALRVDHVDGLRDPLGYLDELQRAVGHAAGLEPFYVVVEKILAGNERLPEDWPVAGTTGYEFLVDLNGLFVDPEGLERLDYLYRRFTGADDPVADIAHDRKLDAMRQLFRGEVNRLARRLAELARRLPHAISPAVVLGVTLAETLTAVAASFPVYRTYVRDQQLPDRDGPYIDSALADAARRHLALDATALGLLGLVLRLDIPADLDRITRRDWVEFVLRWQQLTGPAMAKGFEDTTFYVYNHLLSLNEVGVDVEGMQHPGGVEQFHLRVGERARRWPQSMNATSTHDTKRSEDVRARLDVITELTGTWQEHLARWSAWNEGSRREVGGHRVPDRNEEWLLYQTLVGMWPFERGEEAEVRPRLQSFALKAAREAKVHTSWLDPDEGHEEALATFIDEIFHHSRFVDDLRRFVDLVALPGAVNSLAQVVAKIASPGVPDFYQGTELWNLRLVDPDNRRSVDYGRRRRHLDQIRSRAASDRLGLVREVRGSWRDGRVKLLVTWAGLGLRRHSEALFRDGDYALVAATGASAERIVAFARRLRDEWTVAVVPRLVAGLGKGWPLGERWGDTMVGLPSAARIVREALTGRRLPVSDGGVRIADVFAELPVGLLVPEKEGGRDERTNGGARQGG